MSKELSIPCAAKYVLFFHWIECRYLHKRFLRFSYDRVNYICQSDYVLDLHFILYETILLDTHFVLSNFQYLTSIIQTINVHIILFIFVYMYMFFYFLIPISDYPRLDESKDLSILFFKDNYCYSDSRGPLSSIASTGSTTPPRRAAVSGRSRRGQGSLRRLFSSRQRSSLRSAVLSWCGHSAATSVD